MQASGSIRCIPKPFPDSIIGTDARIRLYLASSSMRWAFNVCSIDLYNIQYSIYLYRIYSSVALIFLLFSSENKIKDILKEAMQKGYIESRLILLVLVGVAGSGKTLKELLQQIRSCSGSGKLLDVDWVYIVDSGGQPQFREMLPHFMYDSSAFIMMQKLNESLRKKTRGG